MADQRTEGAVLAGQRHRRVEHRRLQHRRSHDQPVVRQVVGQRGLLRQHVPAAFGVAAADPLHFLAMPPGRGDQHVAAETAAAHRLHAVIEVAPRRADLDAHLADLLARFLLGGFAQPRAVLDIALQRIADLGGDGHRLLAGGVGQVARGVFAAEHRAGGQVDRVEHLLPARRGFGLAEQDLAAEIEGRIAPRLGKVRGHCIADAPAQVGLPLRRLEAANQCIELREHRRIGHRHGVVADALCLQERIELQVAVLLAEAGGLDRREIALRVAQFDQRSRDGGDALFDIQHRGGFRGQVLLGDAGQREDAAHVIGIARHQRLGVGVAARVIGGVGQAQAALAEVAEVAVERAQVEVGGEVEQHRDTDLVQRGDGGRHVLRLADAVDPRQQRRDRVGAVAFDRGFVESAGPEIAQQFLHVALWRLHRRIQQFALLLLRTGGQLPECGDRAGRWHRVRGQPALVRFRMEVRAGQRDRGRLLLRGRLLRGEAVGRGTAGGEGDDQGEGERARGRHAADLGSNGCPSVAAAP